MSKYVQGSTTTGEDTDTSIGTAVDHGELKRRVAELVGTDPSRYAADRGVERHKRLTGTEIELVADELGIGFVDGTKQELMDTIMLKLGRDHRTGYSWWDVSDLVAVVQRLEDDSDS